MSAYGAAVAHTIGRLRADTELVELVGGRIYSGIAPESTTYPLVVVHGWTDPEDTRSQGGRVLTVVPLVVRGATTGPESQGGGSLADLVAIHDRIDAALDGTDSGRVEACERVGELSSERAEKGLVVRNLGSRFRLVVV